MKAKVKATGEIVEVERVSKNIFGRTDGIVAMYSKDVLDFNLNPPQPAATLPAIRALQTIYEMVDAADGKE